MPSNNLALHRQRFLAALEHRELDRAPLTLGGPSSSLHREAHTRLLQHLGLSEEGEPVIIDNILQIVEPDFRIIEHYDIDVLWLLPQEAPVHWSADRQSYMDEFGRTFVQGGEWFNQVGAPLPEGTAAELERYRFPNLRLHERVTGLREKAKRLYEAGFGLGLDGPWGIYEIASSLRGAPELFMDMGLNPAYVEALAERVLDEHHIPYYTLLLEQVAPYVQLVGVSDDLGSQQGLLFSPRLFRQIFKPRMRRLIEHIHRFTDAKIYMHSDGAVRSLIPDFIEIGVDMLNPLQYTASGMDAASLKHEFGKDLGFFGGTVENEALSFGNPEEVRRIVRDQVRALAPGGGFLFASIHNISQEVPPENIEALFMAGLEYGVYGS